ncbi:apolipoprotein D-like isoform X2 [Amphiura filiformis]|uniref:apolipoprotein D-like isoform X2 n=1 Tax=Amphiura filiformis TaxID=82378 RepID=UPI003B215493
MKALHLSSLLLIIFVLRVKGTFLPLPFYIGPGSCPSVNVVSDFDKDRYFGLWYEIARFPVIYEWNFRCVTAEYSKLRRRPKTIKVTNIGTKKNGELSVAEGRAKTPDANEPGKLSVSFGPMIPDADGVTGVVSRIPGANAVNVTGVLSRIPGANAVAGVFSRIPDVPDFIQDGNYWILETDYDNYALVHSCNQRRGFHTMANWILSRTPIPDMEVIEHALEVFHGYGIPIQRFIFTEQSNCGRDEESFMEMVTEVMEMETEVPE